MSKHIVLLRGSPRKGANTDILADAFVRGAESGGKTITQFRVADMKIGGCLGCGYCFGHDRKCVQNDDMPQVLEALKTADAIAFASPVYFFGITAQLKLAIDRIYALLGGGMDVQRAALLLTCGNIDVTVTEASIAHFRAMSAYLQWQEAGVVAVPHLHERTEIAGNPLLAEAERLGREI